MKDGGIKDVSKSVKWVGVLDEDIVTFDIVMETRYGTTYNSFFIDGDKKTLVETTKETFSDVYLEKIKQLTPLEEIKYIVLNHTEPDHSGNLKNLLKHTPDAVVVGTGQALNYIKEMTDASFESLKVKDGDTLDLGNKTLRFIGAPNLHWPDSMYTYLEDEKVLFTCDSFGAHYCHEEMYNDKVGDYNEAFDYYFDVILKPYSKFMLKAIDKIKPLDIDVICPGHGPILRSNPMSTVEKTERLSREYLDSFDSEKRNVLITYVSAYGYTKHMAKRIADGIIDHTGELDVEVVDIENILPGDLEEKIVRSSAILVGSPTINQNTLLPVYKLFALVNPIRDKGKLAAAFGSYGWSGEAVSIIESQLKNLKLNVISEGLMEKFKPYEPKASKFYDFGKSFAEGMLSEKEK